MGPETRPETTLAAAREASPTPTSESGMPTTLWKWIVENGKYMPCPNRNASMASRSSHTRRSNPKDVPSFMSTGRSYPVPWRGSCKIHTWLPEKEDARARRTGRRTPEHADGSRPGVPGEASLPGRGRGDAPGTHRGRRQGSQRLYHCDGREGA